MSDKTQNINITGGNIGGLQVGDNNTQTITQTLGDEITLEQVFDAVAKDLPEEVVEDTIDPLENLAKMPADEQEATKPKWSNLVERLTPYAPAIIKNVSVFGEAALAAIASSNPVIAGVLALCKYHAK